MKTEYDCLKEELNNQGLISAIIHFQQRDERHTAYRENCATFPLIHQAFLHA